MTSGSDGSVGRLDVAPYTHSSPSRVKGGFRSSRVSQACDVVSSLGSPRARRVGEVEYFERRTCRLREEAPPSRLGSLSSWRLVVQCLSPPNYPLIHEPSERSWDSDDDVHSTSIFGSPVQSGFAKKTVRPISPTRYGNHLALVMESGP